MIITEKWIMIQTYHRSGRPPWSPREIVFDYFVVCAIRDILYLGYNGLCDSIMTSLGTNNIFQSMSDEPRSRDAPSTPHVQ